MSKMNDEAPETLVYLLAVAAGSAVGNLFDFDCYAGRIHNCCAIQ